VAFDDDLIGLSVCIFPWRHLFDDLSYRYEL